MAKNVAAVKKQAEHGEDNTMELMASAFTKSLVRRDFLTRPKQYKRGHNAEEYCREIENYAMMVDAKEDDKVYLFINNLSEDVKYELFGLPDYKKNSGSYDWVKKASLAKMLTPMDPH